VWNYDHQVHAFVFGPDGKFYFNSGNSITDLKWPDGTRVKDLAGNEITNKGQPYRMGMVYRCDLDLETGKASNVETVAHNFRNNYEVCIDSFGTLWQSDNDDDGNKGVRINYVMEYGNYGFSDEMTGAGWQAPRTNLESEIPLRHWHLNDPGVVPNLLQTGAGSPTGILLNESAALGPKFANQLIHCDAGPRTTRAYLVENDGAGYKATMTDVLTSSDPWYRASDLALAPDGSLLVSDWYDPGVGGHAMGDNQPGKIMGRIYRVAATGGAAKAPAPNFSTAEGAVQALQSPNKATQFLAWQTVHTLGTKAEPALRTLWQSENPRLRARALGLLAQLAGSETKYLTAGLSDADANVRIAAVRLTLGLATTRGFDTQPLEDDRELMRKIIRDPSPQVRRQIAVSLHGAKDIAKIWTALARQHNGQDRWYLEALGIGAAGSDETCFDAWLEAVGDQWNTPAGRDIIWRLRSPKNATYLAKLIADSTIAEPEKARYFRAFDFLPATPQKTRALIEIATTGSADSFIREALVRLKGTDLSANPDLAKVLKTTLDRAKGTASFIELVRDFGAANQGSALLDTALAVAKEPAAVDAVKLLVKDPAWEAIVNDALATPKAAAVIDLLGSTGTSEGAGRLSALVSDPNQRPDLRAQAVRALARTQAGAERLIGLAKGNQLSADLAPVAGSALRMVEYAKLKIDIDALFPAPIGLGGKPLLAAAELAKLKGDSEKGRAVFERAESSCITCHRIGSKGADFGPGLSEIGSKLPREQILDAILNPNNGLSMGFETTQLALKDGGLGLGIVRSETPEEVVLALPGGATNKFDKKQITNREKLTTSMMPSGLNQALSQDDLVNLVEYLASLKTAK
jgi:putative membrane-bound dehydrogenase-like protein